VAPQLGFFHNLSQGKERKGRGGRREGESCGPANCAVPPTFSSSLGGERRVGRKGDEKKKKEKEEI